MPGPDASAPMRVNRVLGGRYRLTRPIAKGGMAEVWEGHDDVLSRAVAVKMLQPQMSSDMSLVERFRREAVAAARLTHPGVVATFDTGTDDGTAWIVMELIRGHTLRQLLNERGPMDPPMAVDIAGQIADALAHAHRAGLIHRDIKPANVLLVEEDAGPPRAKVTDFGIAKATEHLGLDLTRTGMVLGTPKYLSPEQVEGREPDARADLYSLGVVLYEMLTCRVPFEGPTDMATAIAHVRQPAPRVSSLRPDVPPELDQLVADLLAKDPDRRVPSAVALRQALARIPLGTGFATPPPLRSPSAMTPSRPLFPEAPPHPIYPRPLVPGNGYAARLTSPPANALSGGVGLRTPGAVPSPQPPPSSPGHPVPSRPPTPSGPPGPLGPPGSTGPGAGGGSGGGGSAGGAGSGGGGSAGRGSSGGGSADGGSSGPPRPSSGFGRNGFAPHDPNGTVATHFDRPISAPTGLLEPRPAPPAAKPRRRRRRWAPGLVVAALLVAGCVVGVILLGGTGLSNDTGLPSIPHLPGTSSTPQAPVEISAVQVWMMVPNRTADNPGETPLTFDGNTATVWSTDFYQSATFSGLYSGEGLAIHLTGSRKLEKLTVTSTTDGWAAQSYVASSEPASGQAVSAWGSPTDTKSDISGSTTLSLGGKSGSWVLLWLTNLGPQFHASVAELKVS